MATYDLSYLEGLFRAAGIKVSTCSSCGARIWWAVSSRTDKVKTYGLKSLEEHEAECGGDKE